MTAGAVVEAAEAEEEDKILPRLQVVFRMKNK